MHTRRTIVLYSEPSDDPNSLASLGGSSGGRSQVEAFDSDDPKLLLLRKSGRVKREAPSFFDVKLIKPLISEAAESSAPPISWGIEETGACRSTLDGTGVIVAVLDTGIDVKHPAFEGIEIIEEDFTGEGNGDGNGHGTHCAGTICGQNVNGTRIGIARGIRKLLVGKVLDSSGAGTTEAIYNGIQWATQNRAHIVSMSLGFDFPGIRQALVNEWYPDKLATSVVLEAYRDHMRLFDNMLADISASKFIGRKALIVAAAGNESRRDVSSDYKISKSSPAAADGILSVAATDRTNKVAWFSNSKAGIAAPGVDIWSAWPRGKFMKLSGTSMATPHVAGVAALWAQRVADPNTGDIIIDEVLDRVRHHAKLPGGVSTDDVGKGIVQAPPPFE